MGKIVEKAEINVNNISLFYRAPGKSLKTLKEEYLAPFQEIESRLEALESIGRDVEPLKGQVELNLRSIGALEKQIKVIKTALDILVLSSSEKPESIPTDKDGKPEGGLESGDWLLGYGAGESSLYIGEFSRMEQGLWIWGNWRGIGKFKREGMGTAQTRLPKDNVDFLFRPKKPKDI